MSKITSDELMQLWVSIYNDYQDKSKTIGRLDQEFIYNEISQFAMNFNTSDIKRWIDHLRFRKPGYVIKDLELILRMGETNVFGEYAFTSETLDLWLFEYGVKKTGGDKWEKESGETKRNKLLREAGRYLNEKKRDWDIHDKRYIRLQEYLKNNPDSHFGEYLRELENKTKKKPIPKTWEKDPLNK